MTMPHERTRAVLQARDFLVELSKNKALPEEVWKGAKHLLRHYPSSSDIEIAGTIEQNSDHFSASFGPIFSASPEFEPGK